MRYATLFTTILFVLTIDVIAYGEKDAKEKPAVKTAKPLVKLNKQGTVLLDRDGNRVLLKTKVVQREALLEFLCCLAQTREHESILALDAKARTVHAALLAIEAKPGKPVRFAPKFHPPTGQEIEIFVQWRDKKQKLHRVSAQTWVRTSTKRYYAVPMKQQPDDLKIPKNMELIFDNVGKELLWFGQMTQKEKILLLTLSKDKEYLRAIEYFFDGSQPRQISVPWVFAGSELIQEPSGENYYLAEGGEVICVANFPQAMIDVGTKSSAEGRALLYEAATEQIPPLGTKVTVELIPKTAKKGASSGDAKARQGN